MKLVLLNVVLIFLLECNSGSEHYIPKNLRAKDITLGTQFINPGKTTAGELVDYAETLQGVPYLYGSIDPTQGFDCSGFITYVFGHFGIEVPRSSKDFTSIQREISLKKAKRGDIILFTGTDSTKREVGHMGIITALNSEGHQFIHSTSGKAYAVTVTPLNKYYQGRFVKVIRIFRDNDM